MRTAWLAAALAATLAPRAAAAIDPDDMPTNTWIAVAPTYVGAPDGGMLYPMGWNNKGGFDPESERIIVMERWYDDVREGSIYANALLAFDVVTEVVTVLKVNNWAPQAVPCADGTEGCAITAELPANMTDPTPVDRHPLGCLAVAGDFGRVYLSNGLNQSAAFGGEVGAAITDTWAFDLAGSRWALVSDTLTAMPNPPYSGPEVMEYDAQNQVVVLFVDNYTQGPETWILDPAEGQQGTWRSIPRDPSAADVHTAGSGIAFDSARNRLVVFATVGINLDPPSAQTWAYSLDDNRWTRLADAPAAALPPGFAYDSTHDVFLALIAEQTFVYDPEDDTWSELATPIDRAGATFYQNVTYDPAHDVFVHQGGRVDRPLWYVLRIGGFDAPPVTDPDAGPAEPEPLDAGAPDASGVDAGSSDPGDSGGCSCRVADGRGLAHQALLGLAMGLLLPGTRRRS